jgi:hypothetical protein
MPSDKKYYLLPLLQEPSIASLAFQPRKMREPMQRTYILGNVTLVLLKEMNTATSLRYQETKSPSALSDRRVG